jgi:hypothetical protein
MLYIDCIGPHPTQTPYLTTTTANRKKKKNRPIASLMVALQAWERYIEYVEHIYV